MVDDPFMLQVFFFAARDELAVAAEVEGREAVGQYGGAGRDDPASFPACHEYEKTHAGDHADAGGVDGNARPLHDVDDGKAYRAGTSGRVDNHLDLVHFSHDVVLDDLLANPFGSAFVNRPG